MLWLVYSNCGLARVFLARVCSRQEVGPVGQRNEFKSKVFAASQAADAWEKTLTFFRRELNG